MTHPTFHNAGRIDYGKKSIMLTPNQSISVVNPLCSVSNPTESRLHTWF